MQEIEEDRGENQKITPLFVSIPTFCTLIACERTKAYELIPGRGSEVLPHRAISSHRSEFDPRFPERLLANAGEVASTSEIEPQA